MPCPAALGGCRGGGHHPCLSLVPSRLWWPGYVGGLGAGDRGPRVGGGSRWDVMTPGGLGMPREPDPLQPPTPAGRCPDPGPLSLLSPPAPLQHQLQTQHLSHHVPPIPLTPHPSGMQPAGLAGLGSASGLLALSGALGAQAQLLAKDDRGVHDAEHRGERRDGAGVGGPCWAWGAGGAGVRCPGREAPPGGAGDGRARLDPAAAVPAPRGWAEGPGTRGSSGRRAAQPCPCFPPGPAARLRRHGDRAGPGARKCRSQPLPSHRGGAGVPGGPCPSVTEPRAAPPSLLLHLLVWRLRRGSVCWEPRVVLAL